MSRTVNCTEEVIVVSHGEEDTGKLAALWGTGKFHPSVIPVIDDLQDQITKEVTARSEVDEELRANIDAEVDARTKGDQELQTNIQSVISTLSTAVQDLQTEISAIKKTTGVPTGAVEYFAMTAAPQGWLKADGSAVSRTNYTDLFNAIGTTFGTGDGSTTFNLPDLRGEFVRGFDDGRGIDSARVFGAVQTDELKIHNHYILEAGGTGAAGDGDTPEGKLINADTWAENDSQNSSHPVVSSTGGTETRPRNVALLACIKY